MKKTAAFIILILILVIGITGCGKNQSQEISDSTIPMQSVTQSFSADNSIQISFDIPLGWHAESGRDYYICAYEGETLPTSPNENGFAESLPNVVEITNYNYLDGYKSSELTDKIKTVYKELAEGKPENYKKYLNESIGADIIYAELKKSQSEQSQEYPNSVAGIFGVLSDEPATDNNDNNTIDYLTEFSCTYVDGDFDRIAVVKYAFEYNERIYKGIYCVLKDVPYMVWGCFDDPVELSSGDIALQVANSISIS